MTLLLFLLGTEMKDASKKDCSTSFLSLLFDNNVSVKTSVASSIGR
jgi:hypothetical protein